MLKRKSLFFFLCLFVLPFFVHAAPIADFSENVSDKIEKTQELLDQEKWNYIGDAWREELLSNRFIGYVHSILEKFNVVFIIFMARNYSLSLEMLFAFMIWLFVLLSMPNYLSFIEKKDYRSVASLAATIGLAHLQVFNILALSAFKILFYRESFWWSIATFILLMIVLVFYLVIARRLGRLIRVRKEWNKRKGVETRVKRIETEIRAQDRASERV